MATTENTTHLPALGAHGRDEAGGLLQHTLVELIALSLIGKQLHWNIAGPGFRELHLHLDELVEGWQGLSDTVAERAVAIGFAPDGRAPAVVSESDLEPVEPGPVSVSEAIGELTTRLVDVSDRVRDRITRIGEIDLSSQDVLIEVSRQLEKDLWMVRSSL
jgi:starvation-inducible DNA-binding protein